MGPSSILLSAGTSKAYTRHRGERLRECCGSGERILDPNKTTAKKGEFTCIFNVQFNDGFLRVLRGQSGLSEGFSMS